MNQNTNSKKKFGGFTLVEVIVVAVIVLILSAVAIPLYNGFVRSAREDTAQNLAETGAAAANAIWRRTGQDPANVGVLNIHFDNTKHSVALGTAPNAGRIEVRCRDLPGGLTSTAPHAFAPYR